MTDTLQKFMFENSPVRGELVELSEAWRHVLDRRSYPAPVTEMLGEMMAAAALLSGLPITVVFLLAQRWMISGLAAGGVKG